MKRMIIICEGPTEQEFCKDVLTNYFMTKNISIECPTIKHSNGGIVSWNTLKKQIIMHLNEGDCFVTLLIDYYRIKDSYNFPGWIDSKNITNIYDRMHFLFDKMSLDLDEELRPRFIPYIQLHEFEALLFSDNSGFEYYFNEKEYRKTAEIISSFNNPEDINSSPDGAPSKRLLAIKHDYNKVLEGNLIALEIGIDAILVRCPGFASWIQAIIEH